MITISSSNNQQFCLPTAKNSKKKKKTNDDYNYNNNEEEEVIINENQISFIKLDDYTSSCYGIYYNKRLDVYIYIYNMIKQIFQNSQQ